MVSEKRRRYMREYMARKRALEKQASVVEQVKPEVVPEGCSPASVPDFSCCPHCRSKHISRNGNVVSCRACGVRFDLGVVLGQKISDEEVI